MNEEPTRVIYLQTDIDYEKPAEIIQQIHTLNRLDENKQRVEYITLHLSTFGGEVTAGLALCDAIRTSVTPIHIIVSGVCASMGIPILASGHKRSALKHSSFMIHQINTFMPESNLEYIKKDLKYCEELNEMMDSIITSNTKITQKQLDKIYKKGEEFNFLCEKALKWGLIEEIL